MVLTSARQRPASASARRERQEPMLPAWEAGQRVGVCAPPACGVPGCKPAVFGLRESQARTPTAVRLAASIARVAPSRGSRPRRNPRQRPHAVRTVRMARRWLLRVAVQMRCFACGGRWDRHAHYMVTCHAAQTTDARQAPIPPTAARQAVGSRVGSTTAKARTAYIRPETFVCSRTKPPRRHRHVGRLVEAHRELER